MRIIFWMLTTYLLLVLQTSMVPSCAIGPFQPNLLIAGCVQFYFGSHSRWSIAGAACWGLAIDALGSGTLGINLISWTLVSAMIVDADDRGRRSLGHRMLISVAAVVPLTAVAIATQWPWEQILARSRDLTVFVAGSALYSWGIAAVWIVSGEFLRQIVGGRQLRSRNTSAWG